MPHVISRSKHNDRAVIEEEIMFEAIIFKDELLGNPYIHLRKDDIIDKRKRRCNYNTTRSGELSGET